MSTSTAILHEWGFLACDSYVMLPGNRITQFMLEEDSMAAMPWRALSSNRSGTEAWISTCKNPDTSHGVTQGAPAQVPVRYAVSVAGTCAAQ